MMLFNCLSLTITQSLFPLAYRARDLDAIFLKMVGVLWADQQGTEPAGKAKC
jgi:hypothetical protein